METTAPLRIVPKNRKVANKPLGLNWQKRQDTSSAKKAIQKFGIRKFRDKRKAPPKRYIANTEALITSISQLDIADIFTLPSYTTEYCDEGCIEIKFLVTSPTGQGFVDQANRYINGDIDFMSEDTFLSPNAPGLTRLDEEEDCELNEKEEPACKDIQNKASRHQSFIDHPPTNNHDDVDHIAQSSHPPKPSPQPLARPRAKYIQENYTHFVSTLQARHKSFPSSSLNSRSRSQSLSYSYSGSDSHGYKYAGSGEYPDLCPISVHTDTSRPGSCIFSEKMLPASTNAKMDANHKTNSTAAIHPTSRPKLKMRPRSYSFISHATPTTLPSIECKSDSMRTRTDPLAMSRRKSTQRLSRIFSRFMNVNDTTGNGIGCKGSCAGAGGVAAGGIGNEADKEKNTTTAESVTLHASNSCLAETKSNPQASLSKSRSFLSLLSRMPTPSSHSQRMSNLRTRTRAQSLIHTPFALSSSPSSILNSKTGTLPSSHSMSTIQSARKPSSYTGGGKALTTGLKAMKHTLSKTHSLLTLSGVSTPKPLVVSSGKVSSNRAHTRDSEPSQPMTGSTRITSSRATRLASDIKPSVNANTNPRTRTTSMTNLALNLPSALSSGIKKGLKKRDPVQVNGGGSSALVGTQVKGAASVRKIVGERAKTDIKGNGRFVQEVRKNVGMKPSTNMKKDQGQGLRSTLPTPPKPVSRPAPTPTLSKSAKSAPVRPRFSAPAVPNPSTRVALKASTTPKSPSTPTPTLTRSRSSSLVTDSDLSDDDYLLVWNERRARNALHTIGVTDFVSKSKPRDAHDNLHPPEISTFSPKRTELEIKISHQIPNVRSLECSILPSSSSRSFSQYLQKAEQEFSFYTEDFSSLIIDEMPLWTRGLNSNCSQSFIHEIKESSSEDSFILPITPPRIRRDTPIISQSTPSPRPKSYVPTLLRSPSSKIMELMELEGVCGMLMLENPIPGMELQSDAFSSDSSLGSVF